MIGRFVRWAFRSIYGPVVSEEILDGLDELLATEDPWT